MNTSECILALDVGNTQTEIGVFRGPHLAARWRMSTQAGRTDDELTAMLTTLMQQSGIDPSTLDGLVVSSVVPPVTRHLRRLAARLVKPEATPLPLLEVTHRIPLGFSLAVPLPEQVGADRLVNAEAGVTRYALPLLLVDSGTATTFCHIDGDRNYRGGAITPGLHLCAEALFSKASRLAAVDLLCPPTVVGTTTEAALQSGLVHGYACLVDGMIEKIANEVGSNLTVVGTGGVMELLHGVCRRVDVFDPLLTLDGLYCLWRRWRLDPVLTGPRER